jgi:predicted DCC family thiol-disulfide oxidoreductase YuxK
MVNDRRAPDETVTVIFDDDCGFCRWSIDRLLRWDRGDRIHLVTLRSAEADRLLAGMPAERRYASWHLVTPDGHIASGGRAVAPLLRRLPGGAPIAAIASAMPGPTDAAYRLVARNRGRLGELLGEQRCAVHLPEPTATNPAPSPPADATR